MRSFNNKKGFTLIEIIVVLIIIGVLAGIALPNLFSNVAKSNGTAALAAMDGIKSQIETCIYQNNSIGNWLGPCTPATFGINNPNDFFITISVPGGPPFGTVWTAGGQTATSGAVVAASGRPSTNNLTYSIVAWDISSHYLISLTRDTEGGFSCSAPSSGPYAGVC